MIKRDFDICSLLRELRNKREISQSELGTLIKYSVRQIQRFESDPNSLSGDAIKRLSDFYNHDLSKYIDVSYTFSNVSEYKKYEKLYMLIEDNKYDAIKEVCNELKSTHCLDNSNIRQLVNYCDALLLSKVNCNYKESITICFKLLTELNNYDYSKSLEEGVLSEISYLVLFLMVFNYTQLEEEKIYSDLVTQLHEHFDKLLNQNTIPVKNNMYSIYKHYTASLNNMANIHLFNKDYDKAMFMIDKAIDFANTNRVTTLLPYFIVTKSEIYFLTNDIVSARKYFNHFESVCDLRDMNNYYNFVKLSLEKEYPLLFED